MYHPQVYVSHLEEEIHKKFQTVVTRCNTQQHQNNVIKLAS